MCMYGSLIMQSSLLMSSYVCLFVLNRMIIAEAMTMVMTVAIVVVEVPATVAEDLLMRTIEGGRGVQLEDTRRIITLPRELAVTHVTVATAGVMPETPAEMIHI